MAKDGNGGGRTPQKSQEGRGREVRSSGTGRSPATKHGSLEKGAGKTQEITRTAAPPKAPSKGKEGEGS